MFNHIHHEIQKLVRVDSPDGRKYQTPEGKSYPSVTSVVGLHGKQAILEWRKRVGEEEANKISARASKRGTAIHSLCEDYLNNKTPEPNLFDIEAFNSIRGELDKINNIRCLETQLYSDYLQVAGTVDCIAEYDGKVSVIDFKTSSRLKEKDDIHSYFMQTAAYAVMFEERTKIPIVNLVTIMAVDNSNQPLVFKEHRDNHANDLIRKIRLYEREKGISYD